MENYEIRKSTTDGDPFRGTRHGLVFVLTLCDYKPEETIAEITDDHEKKRERTKKYGKIVETRIEMSQDVSRYSIDSDHNV